MTRIIKLFLFASLAILPVLLCLQLAARADSCGAWSEQAGSVIDQAFEAIGEGRYSDAIAMSRKALLTLPAGCALSRGQNFMQFNDKRGLQYALVTALIWNHEPHNASEEAAPLISDVYLFPRNQQQASQNAIEGKYAAAFSAYRSILAAGDFPSTAELQLMDSGGGPGVKAFLTCVNLGAKRDYAAANRCLSKQVNQDSQLTLYLFGISQLAIGERCSAYKSFRQTLVAAPPSLQPRLYPDWASVSTINAIVSIFFNNVSNPGTKGILRTC
jgi:hypothetical protein